MGLSRTLATCNGAAVGIAASPISGEVSRLRSGSRWRRRVAEEAKDKENLAPLPPPGRTPASTAAVGNAALMPHGLPNRGSALPSSGPEASACLTVARKKRNPATVSKKGKRLCNRSGTLDGDSNVNGSVDIITMDDTPKPKKAAPKGTSLWEACNADKEEGMAEMEDEAKDSDSLVNFYCPSLESNELTLLQSTYDKCYKKYNNLKMKQHEEVEAAFDNQNLIVSTYVKAVEELVDHLQRDIDSLRQKLQENHIQRTSNRLLEKMNAECKNDLVLEKAKNLELRQHIKHLEEILLQKGPNERTNSRKHHNINMLTHFSCSSISIKDRDLTVDEVEIGNNDANKSKCINKTSEICAEGAVSGVALPEACPVMNYSRLNFEKIIRNIQFDLYGKPSIQLVSSAVQTMNNSLMNSLPVMISHPLVTLFCSCTVSAEAAFRNHTMEDSEQWHTPHHLKPEQEVHALSGAIKKRNERIQTLSNVIKLLQDLLEQLLGLKVTISSEGPAHLTFLHEATGLSFSLMSASDRYVTDCFEGGQLLYQKLSLGTLQKKAMDWMRESELIFALSQVQAFFKRLMRTAHGGRGFLFL